VEVLFDEAAKIELRDTAAEETAEKDSKEVEIETEEDFIRNVFVPHMVRGNMIAKQRSAFNRKHLNPNLEIHSPPPEMM